VHNVTLILRLKSGMLMMRDKLLVMLLKRICWEPNRRQRSRDSIHGQLLSFPPSLPLLARFFSNAARPGAVQTWSLTSGGHSVAWLALSNSATPVSSTHAVSVNAYSLPLDCNHTRTYLSASVTYQPLGYEYLVRILVQPRSFLSATVARRSPES